MNRSQIRFFVLLFNLAAIAGSTSRTAAAEPDLRAGKLLLPTKVYSAREDQEVLKQFEGLRVSDVSDGMDQVGLPDVGLVSPEIHTLWRDTVNYTHRFVGIAVTVRYVPAQLPHAGAREPEAFDRWVGDWYAKISSEPFVELLRPGTALVIEEAPQTDVGSIGSNNILGWKLRGCVGVVTSGTARDTDEIAAEKVPLYFQGPGRGIRPGRNQVESVNRPVVVGGVTVMPGDVIVADGDGVIVVPRQHATAVAGYARATLDGDKAGRRSLYEKLKIPLDESVR
jgi:regulator of RNase E activity RraA